MSPRPSATSARHWPRPPRAETSEGPTSRRVSASPWPTRAAARKRLRHLDAALSQASGVPAARVRLRRGSLLGLLGRTSEAIEEHRRAARTLRAAGDSVWEARALNNLGLALIHRGDAPRAEDALTRAEALLADAGQTFDAANVRSNRGLVASLYGQVPEALAHYDAAEIMYADAGVRSAELSEVRCSALLAVGLYDDALRHGQEAVGLLRSQGAAAAYRADALVRAAQAALAAGDPQIAREYATEAVRLFRRQGRGRGETLARLTIVRARFASGERSRRLLSDAANLAAAADRHRMAEAVEAHLLTGQVALALGDAAAANPHLLRTARARSRGSALNRVIGWHASALRAEAAGSRRALFAACERGLQVIDAYQLTLGAAEMRAAATTHGAALTTIAVREALAADDPLMLLRWAERWRARTFAIPPVRPPMTTVRGRACDAAADHAPYQPGYGRRATGRRAGAGTAAPRRRGTRSRTANVRQRGASRRPASGHRQDSGGTRGGPAGGNRPSGGPHSCPRRHVSRRSPSRRWHVGRCRTRGRIQPVRTAAARLSHEARTDDRHKAGHQVRFGAHGPGHAGDTGYPFARADPGHGRRRPR